MRAIIIAAAIAAISTPAAADFIRHSDGERTYVAEVAGANIRLGAGVERFATIEEALTDLSEVYLDGSDEPELVANVRARLAPRAKPASVGTEIRELRETVAKLAAEVADIRANGNGNGNGRN